MEDNLEVSLEIANDLLPQQFLFWGVFSVDGFARAFM